MSKKFIIGDRVKINTGKYRGKLSSIISINRVSGRVLIKDINVMLRSRKNGKSDSCTGFIRKEMSIHISNISHVDKDSIASRIGFKYIDGERIRFYKKTRQILVKV